jgi:hypothetical protein
LYSVSSEMRSRRKSRRLGLCLSFLAHERMAWRISSFDMAFSSFGRDLEIVELVFQALWNWLFRQLCSCFGQNKSHPVVGG